MKPAYLSAEYAPTVEYDPECVMDVRSILHSEATDPKDDDLIAAMPDDYVMHLFFDWFVETSPSRKHPKKNN